MGLSEGDARRAFLVLPQENTPWCRKTHEFLLDGELVEWQDIDEHYGSIQVARRAKRSGLVCSFRLPSQISTRLNCTPGMLLAGAMPSDDRGFEGFRLDVRTPSDFIIVG